MHATATVTSTSLPYASDWHLPCADRLTYPLLTIIAVLAAPLVLLGAIWLVATDAHRSL